MNKAALLSAVFGSGVAWSLTMFGWTADNLLLGIGNGAVISAIVGVPILGHSLFQRRDES